MVSPLPLARITSRLATSNVGSPFTPSPPHPFTSVPKQSTRHTYRTRRERNANAAKKAKLILLFAVIIGVLLIIRSWDEIALWLRALTM